MKTQITKHPETEYSIAEVPRWFILLLLVAALLKVMPGMSLFSS